METTDTPILTPSYTFSVVEPTTSVSDSTLTDTLYSTAVSSVAMCKPAIVVTKSFVSPDDEEQISQMTEEIKEENTVDVKTLSSHRNKLISVKDDRPSSKTIGLLGSLFIGFIFTAIVLSDLPRILRDIRHIFTL